MHELLAEDVVRHLNGKGASVVHWAFGLSVPLTWPQGKLSCSEPATAADDSVAPTQAKPETLQSAPQPAEDPDKALVKVLERRDFSGKVNYLVQEEGKPRGVLAYGIPPPPDKLPQIGEEIAVYRNNRDFRSPQYRWDKPVTYRGKPKGGPGGQRPRGGK